MSALLAICVVAVIGTAVFGMASEAWPDSDWLRGAFVVFAVPGVAVCVMAVVAVVASA